MLVGVVCGQQAGDINFDLEQVADCVLVFRTVEAMKSLSPAGYRSGECGSVEFGLKVGDQRCRGGVVWPRPSRRRHSAHSKFSDHVLPDRGSGVNPSQVHRIEGKPRGVQLGVVTGDAVAVEQSPVWRGRPRNGSRLAFSRG